MKTQILVGAVAALLYGGVALAGDGKDCPPSTTGTEPVDSSIGGSGTAATESNLTGNEVGEDEKFGGMRQDALGGSGSIQDEPMREPEVPPQASTPSDAFTPIEDTDADVRKESRADMRGLTVTLGGGVEGYTGALAPEINPGVTYGVTAALKPSKVFGLELSYSGAVNNLDADTDVDGPDLVRNGGQAAVTLGLGAAPVQPYVLGGIGFSDYNFRGATPGFSDDTVGNVPVGAGLRSHMGDVTIDVRGNYSFLFDQDFAGVDDGLNENGRYSGTLNIGGTF